MFQAIMKNPAGNCRLKIRSKSDRMLQDLPQVRPEGQHATECSHQLCLTNMITLVRESHSHNIILSGSTTVVIHVKIMSVSENIFFLTEIKFNIKRHLIHKAGIVIIKKKCSESPHTWIDDRSCDIAPRNQCTLETFTTFSHQTFRISKHAKPQPKKNGLRPFRKVASKFSVIAGTERLQN